MSQYKHKTISVSDYYINIWRYVGNAVKGKLALAGRGRTVASCSFIGFSKGAHLPDREAFIHKLPRIQADSVEMVAEDRSGR